MDLEGVSRVLAPILVQVDGFFFLLFNLFFVVLMLRRLFYKNKQRQ